MTALIKVNFTDSIHFPNFLHTSVSLAFEYILLVYVSVCAAFTVRLKIVINSNFVLYLCEEKVFHDQ